VVVDFQIQQRQKEEASEAEGALYVVGGHMSVSCMNICRHFQGILYLTYPSYTCDFKNSSISCGQRLTMPGKAGRILLTEGLLQQMCSISLNQGSIYLDSEPPGL